jgi:tetratricopeptide (TPR) repeat protein
MSIVRCGIMGDMANSDMHDTVPFTVSPPPEEGQLQPKDKKRSPWRMVTLIGIIALVLIGLLSAYAGYASGISERKAAEVALTTEKAKEQFDLAVQDINEGQYQRARQRLEYVAQLDPNYPDLTNRLAEVLARINATATPTPVPTPTIAPTVDTRGVEGMFSQGQQLVANGDWTGAIETLLTLRKTDPSYQAVPIDGLLFIALRNRGLEKIAKQADLEGGLYDLTLASRFGPLDTEAQGYITWVSLYITGASFWDLDWAKVIEYFSQVGPALPGLSDRSGMTARERYRLALKNYGMMLVAQGDPCAGAEQFQISLTVGPDPEVDQLLAEAFNACQGATTEEVSGGEAPPVTTEAAPPPVGTIPPPVETTPPYPIPTP